MDTLTPDQRSHLMSRIHSCHTKPEIEVRRLLHHMGYRFRLHRRDLPGKPDIVLPKHRKIIFVHGCFWHGHSCRSLPKSNAEFWAKKISSNRVRDAQTIQALSVAGWSVLEVWECALREKSALREQLSKFILAE